MAGRTSWKNVSAETYIMLAETGHSYKEIAELYDTSRSAVAGKVTRWKRDGMVPKNVRAREPGQRKSDKPRSNAPAPKAPVVPPVVVAPVFEPLPVRPEPLPPLSITTPLQMAEKSGVKPVSLLDLATGQCAFIVAERPTFYCAVPVDPNSSFRMCTKHMELCELKSHRGLLFPQAKKRPIVRLRGFR